MQNPKIAVIGGGISGLSAARKLQELLGKSALPHEVIVFESSDRVGGVIRTTSELGCLTEEGPDSFITQKPWALDLCRSLDMEHELLGTREEKRMTMVVKNGKLHQLPDGFILMAPTRLDSFLFSPLFSIGAKIRMGMEFFIAPDTSKDDETLADFVRRRLGKEALERVAQPMISGIYAADPECLSLKATMPRFLEMERNNGGVLRSLIASRNYSAGGDSGARYSLFMTPRKGMSRIIERLSERLAPGTIATGREIERITPQVSGYRLVDTAGSVCEAAAVIIATPAHKASSLLVETDRALSENLASIRTASTAVINLLFRKDDLPSEPNAVGFVVPAVERLSMIACTFSSLKFDGRSSKDVFALRVFAGGELNPEILEHDDRALINMVEQDLRNLLGISTRPVHSTVCRHLGKMPQFDLGHLELAERIHSRASRFPGLALAGNSYRGIGVPDCIKSGESAAERIFGQLEKSMTCRRQSA